MVGSLVVYMVGDWIYFWYIHMFGEVNAVPLVGLHGVPEDVGSHYTPHAIKRRFIAVPAERVGAVWSGDQAVPQFLHDLQLREASMPLSVVHVRNNVVWYGSVRPSCDDYASLVSCKVSNACEYSILQKFVELSNYVIQNAFSYLRRTASS